MNELEQWPGKTPGELFPVAVDWSALARGHELVAVSVGVLSGTVAIDQPDQTTFDDTTQTVWLSGGVVGEYASFICTATFSDGAIFAQRFYLYVS